MRRLQFRHHIDIFENRELALQYFENIVNVNHTASTEFGTSCFAEPMVARYKDENGNVQIILSIGAGDEHTKYHLIDSSKLIEDILANSNAISTENARALAVEDSLSKAISSEAERAKAAEDDIRQNISNNLTSIEMVEPSSANVLEEYALKNAKGDILGDNIKIYRDSSLVGATIGFKGAISVVKNDDNSFTLSYSETERDESIEYLYLIYRDENADLKLVGIDFENFLMESEFGNGLKVIDRVVSLKIKDGEEFLTIDENGLASVGIRETMEGLINSLNDALNADIVAEKNRAEEAEAVLRTSINGLDSKVDAEIERAKTAEISLETKIEDEISRAKEIETDLGNQIQRNKIASKDLIITESEIGTNVSIQTDEITITKLADVTGIYETNVAILGSLLKIKRVDSPNSAVQSRYELQGADGKLIGDAIELPVESALVDVRSGKLGASINVNTGAYTEGTGIATLDFIYRLSNGTYKLMQVKVSDYFTDAHFGRGLNNQDGIVSLLEGDGNEEYLVIGEDTIAIVGVNSAIETAKIDAIGQSASYTDTELGKREVSINERINILSGTLTSQINTVGTNLNNEISNREIAISGLNSRFDTVVNDVNTKNEANLMAIEGEAKARQLADEALQANINAEVEARVNADKEIKAELSAFIASEVSDRKADVASARTDLNALISIETNTRISEDTAIRTSVDNINNRIDSIIGTDNNKTIRDIAKDEAALKVAEVVADADTSFDTLKEIADWIQNDTTGAAKIANDVKEAVRTIESISGTVNSVVYGDGNDSINHRISDELNQSLVVNGLPVTNISLESASTYSLMRKISTNDGEKYFVSNLAEDMWYRNAEGNNENLNTSITDIKTKLIGLDGTVNSVSGQLSDFDIRITKEVGERQLADSNLQNSINQEIIDRTAAINTLNNENSSLKLKVSELEATISGLNTTINELRQELESLNNGIEQRIIDTIKAQLVGVTNEIKISDNSEGKTQIGFADDAIFGYFSNGKQ